VLKWGWEDMGTKGAKRKGHSAWREDQLAASNWRLAGAAKGSIGQLVEAKRKGHSAERKGGRAGDRWQLNTESENRGKGDKERGWTKGQRDRGKRSEG